MKRHYLLPLIAVLGLVITVWVVLKDSHPASIAVPEVQAPLSPYPNYITGTGIVETPLGNTAIGTPVAGIVTEINVQVGDHVRANELLFKIDDRDIQAQLLVMAARLREARAALLLPTHKHAYAMHLAGREKDVVSKQELSDLNDAVKLGASSLELAKAQVKQLQVEIERRAIRAPGDGLVLQMNLRLGEFVDSATATKPLMLFGNDKRLNIRADIDENDEWRVQPGSAATAVPRGNPTLKLALRFEYIEPLVLAKTALTGQATERTDQRVLQVIYSFDPNDLPVYVGQQMDVFIPISTPADTPTPRRTDGNTH